MSCLGALVASLFASAEERARAQARGALTTLRAARVGVAQRIESIERARAYTLTQLRAVDATAARERARFLVGSLRDIERRQRDHYALLASVDASLARLDDAQALLPTIDALRSSTRSSVGVDASRVQRIVDEASERQQELADAYAALTDVAPADDAIDDATLDRELKALCGGGVADAVAVKRAVDDDSAALSPPPSPVLAT